MALQTNAAAGIYLSIADGKIVRTYKEAQPGTTPRVTKTGKTVHEQRFDTITGFIVGLSVRENDYGKQWQLTMQDGDEKYIVSMPYSSRYSTSFLKSLPNIDLSKIVKLMPWSMTDKNDASKKVNGITMWQDGVKIMPAFTKDNPNGLPPMVQVKVKGTIVWDDTDMMSFLEEKAMAIFSKVAPASNQSDEDLPF
jgi:hypothetical protein